MERAYNYSDICLIPRYSELKSRSDADISISFLDRKFAVPFLPANMQSVINEDICKWLSFNQMPYAYHRFGDTKKFLIRTRQESWPFVSISIGVNQVDRQLIDDISESKCRVDWIFVDIAHGFSVLMKEMIQYIKNRLPQVKVIAGNVWGDKDSVESLENWGADCIKVGVGPGLSCETAKMTGFSSYPMFSAALEAGFYASVPLIIDGGIRCSGDITKAIVAVTKTNRNIPMVMVGSLLAACKDAPGDNIYSYKTVQEYDRLLERTYPKEVKDKITHKKYFGSASAKNKLLSGQPIKHIEGKEVLLECNGKTYAEQYEEFGQALKSSISYSGGRDLQSLSAVKWVTVK